MTEIQSYDTENLIKIDCHMFHNPTMYFLLYQLEKTLKWDHLLKKKEWRNHKFNV